MTGALASGAVCGCLCVPLTLLQGRIRSLWRCIRLLKGGWRRRERDQQVWEQCLGVSGCGLVHLPKAETDWAELWPVAKLWPIWVAHNSVENGHRIGMLTWIDSRMTWFGCGMCLVRLGGARSRTSLWKRLWRVRWRIRHHHEIDRYLLD